MPNDAKPYSKEEIANSTIWAFTDHPRCNENCRRLGSDLDHAAERRYLAAIRERDTAIKELTTERHRLAAELAEVTTSLEEAVRAADAARAD